MVILGISAFYHDSAAALIKDGEILAAVQEERFSRVKNDERFPVRSVDFCLRSSGLRPEDVDHVVFYEKPLLKFDRILETAFAFAPWGFSSFARSFPLWMKEKLYQKRLLAEGLSELDPEVDWAGRLMFSGHHLSHAASAFFASPFDEAAILTLDAVGEWATASVSHGRGRQIESGREIRFPHSLGLLYSAITDLCGFAINSGEYKLMGLAPYGVPRYAEIIEKHLIHVKDDGSFRLNLAHFNYCTGLTMSKPSLERLLAVPRRQRDAPILQEHMDLAASAQKVTEDVIFKMARQAKETYGSKNLCLAGGVAQNSVANGKLLKSGLFENIWVQPAAGDAGGALGAALAVHHLHLGNARRPGRDLMRGAFLGPSYSNDEVRQCLNEAGASYQELGASEILDRTCQLLAEGKVVGWFQGRTEFGPRALGARSILADPRDPAMRERVNAKIKFREPFRPFAAAVLEANAHEWFHPAKVGPYMQFVAEVLPDRQRDGQSMIPAVTHVDGSCRVQTVSREENPVFTALIERFREMTGCPMLLNTSLNVNEEPIVCSPLEAHRAFVATDLDAMVINGFLLLKTS
jgi:carbamoyltransferase